MALSKTEKLARVHDESMKLFNSVQSSMRNERLQCLKDRRFYSVAGAQWEGNLGVQFENKPKLEINKVHLAVMRIVSERRNNRIDVQFISKDGNDAADLAETCQGLFRADEQDSSAEEAYDNAFEEAVGGGFGAFRLRAELEEEYDDTDGRQRIRIEPIVDADSSVFFDLGAKRMDKSDAKHCWVLNAMTHEDYQDTWGELPDDRMSSHGTSMQKVVSQSFFDWSTPDVIYVAEYYRVEESKEGVQIWTDLGGNETSYDQEEFDEEEGLEAELKAIGSVLTETKKLSRRRVHKYIMNGSRVVEDCGIIAGQHIPIVPVYGKRWFVDNVERCMGHVRLATDAQRLLNMQVSKLAEIAAISSVQKPIFTAEQMAGHTTMWSEDNIRNYPYLLINSIANPDGSISPAGPVGYTKSPDVPPALAAIVQMTNNDLLEVLGNQGQGDKMVSNIGEKTAMLAANRVDMQTYIFTDNFGKALRRAGQIWLSMAKEVYEEAGREMKSLDGSGGVSSIKLKQPMMTNGIQVSANDLEEANFDVAVSIGPASQSRKQAVVRTVTELLPMFAQADPQTAQVLGMYAVRNLEGEGMQDLHEWMRKKLVAAGVISPTDQDKTDAQGNQPQPDPQMVAQVQAMQAMADQATADASLKRVKILQATAEAQATVADSEKTKAETMALIQNMKTEELHRLLGMIAQLRSNGQMA